MSSLIIYFITKFRLLITKRLSSRPAALFFNLDLRNATAGGRIGLQEEEVKEGDNKGRHQ